MLSFLVLDYYRPQETKTCLKSIRDNCKVDHQIYYLNNGALDYYPYDYLKQGLCDILISRRVNNGGGYGTEDLYKICDTEFAVYVQCDQWLNMPICQKDLDIFSYGLSLGHSCIDLAGAQCGEGIYSERANLMSVELYNSIKGKPHGGPGPFGDYEHNEGYIQRYFKENNMTVGHVTPYFANNGKWSIREHPCGGITKHSTDEKKLYVIKRPTSKTNSIGIGEEDWKKVVNGEWNDGNIPREWMAHSFKYWEE